MRNTWQKLKHAGSIWYEYDSDHMAASVSYYSLFGLVPLILLTLASTSLLFGRELVGEYLLGLGAMLGDDTLSLLVAAIGNLEHLTGHFSVPLLGAVFFSGMTIVMINTFTGGLMDIWQVSHRGVRGWFNKSFRSACFVVILQLFLLAMIALQWGVGLLGVYVSLWLANGLLFITSFLMLAFLIALAYGTLLWEAPSWHARWLGALAASVLIYIAKFLVASYVAITPFPGLFGAAGLLVVLLIWVYTTVSILYFGAALAYVIDRS